MNASQIQPSPAIPASSELIEAKRAAFQSALLKKSVEMQQLQQVQLAKETEGKGNLIDIRV